MGSHLGFFYIQGFFFSYGIMVGLHGMDFWFCSQILFQCWVWNPHQHFFCGKILPNGEMKKRLVTCIYVTKKWKKYKNLPKARVSKQHIVALRRLFAIISPSHLLPFKCFLLLMYILLKPFIIYLHSPPILLPLLQICWSLSPLVCTMY